MMTTWNIDGAHSTASFTVKHMMITNVRGEFQKLAGTVVYDAEQPEATKVEVTIDTASISTHEPQRDAHLKGADFFDAEHYPNLTFKSKSARVTEAGLSIVGDLTMHGVTKEVALAVETPSTEHKDPWGNTRIGASATTAIKRSAWNMVWNNFIEAGGLLVGDDVKIALDISLVKAAP